MRILKIIVLFCLFQSCKKDEPGIDINLRIKGSYQPLYAVIERNRASSDTAYFDLNGYLNYWDINKSKPVSLKVTVYKSVVDSGSLFIEWYNGKQQVKTETLVTQKNEFETYSECSFQ